MGIIQSNTQKIDAKTIHFHLADPKDLLLIFTRNPVLGKCKTRLAAKVGDQVALDIYTDLLHHTASITKDLPVHKQVFYSEEIWENDLWDNLIYDKRPQQGSDLGERMANAFLDGFENAFERIIIIGSDMYDLERIDLANAFKALHENDYVIGPATDGGYYLLGMKSYNDKIFKNKAWGTNKVFEDTMNDMTNDKVFLLETKNDIDHYEDILPIKAFHKYLKNL
ncbi:TIGR04282 family arsenosugar biosynthesis glycosyltransferase [Maribacter polysaccharolyticus]|uniref:TIGR04282 family arsenosugar biosynthesis glycosyltransferase n=1 Tax=Maribacter polysaccharolyticus TaxID=3020831 RepID=UPI00237F05AB|nr:TIGR04282 family arsenosugar biosynthesis glycosyltransferase [Maribacter polysaccharolyticus]MDE3742897.1 TIGR04282 family arsenosugar biosynthesis glycosyltransferase [Maribacter polysaccharolyticus]